MFVCAIQNDIMKFMHADMQLLWILPALSYSIHRSSHGIPRPPFIPFSQSASFYRSENSSKEGIQDT